MSGPFMCTEETPWTKDVKAFLTLHPSAREVRGSQRDNYPHGDMVTVRCPVCGYEWERELPQ